MNHCEICGRNTLYEHNHKCDPKKLARIDAARKREPAVNPKLTFTNRLCLGFFMLSLNER